MSRVLLSASSSGRLARSVASSRAASTLPSVVCRRPASPVLRLAPLAAAPGPEPSSSPAPPQSSPEIPKQLTTWEYSKLRDPGFVPWFVAMIFLPFVLLLVPLLSSPPMAPVPPSLQGRTEEMGLLAGERRIEGEGLFAGI